MPEMFDRIEKLLKEKNISKRKLAQLAKIPSTTLQSALSRKHNISISLFESLAKALEVTPAYLLTGESDMSGQSIAATHREKHKRFVPVSTYQKLTGLSYPTVMHMVKTDQVKHITTEGGLIRIDTQEAGADTTVILKRLDEQDALLKALCRQFNTAI